MILVMTIVSLLVIAVFIAVLIIGLIQIIRALEAIGGERAGYSGKLSDLGLIAFGVRAIERQTSHLGPSLAELNHGLVRAADGLKQIDRNLTGTLEAVNRQREG